MLSHWLRHLTTLGANHINVNMITRVNAAKELWLDQLLPWELTLACNTFHCLSNDGGAEASWDEWQTNRLLEDMEEDSQCDETPGQTSLFTAARGQGKEYKTWLILLLPIIDLIYCSFGLSACQTHTLWPLTSTLPYLTETSLYTPETSPEPEGWRRFASLMRGLQRYDIPLESKKDSIRNSSELSLNARHDCLVATQAQS